MKNELWVKYSDDEISTMLTMLLLKYGDKPFYFQEAVELKKILFPSKPSRYWAFLADLAEAQYIHRGTNDVCTITDKGMEYINAE